MLCSTLFFLHNNNNKIVIIARIVYFSWFVRSRREFSIKHSAKKALKCVLSLRGIKVSFQKVEQWKEIKSYVVRHKRPNTARNFFWIFLCKSFALSSFLLHDLNMKFHIHTKDSAFDFAKSLISTIRLDHLLYYGVS